MTDEQIEEAARKHAGYHCTSGNDKLDAYLAEIRSWSFEAGVKWAREQFEQEKSDLVYQCKSWEKAANLWMKERDALKEKYEPSELIHD